MSRVVRVAAPAKVNPQLAVLGRRPDGFHELDTEMVALDLCDVVTLEAASTPGIEVHVTGPARSDDVPADGTNLAARAVAGVLERAGKRAPAGVRLEVEKHVPSRAGLGGGSSDAAAAVLGALALVGVDGEEVGASALLAELGSDCAFFYEAATTGHARCKGRGERVEELAPIDPSWCFALLVPDLAAPTGAVFDAFARVLSEGGTLPSVRERLLSRPEAEVRLGLFNRLEAAALDAVPALRAWRDLLDRCDARHFLLSGSGSSYFGLYRDPDEAAASLRALVRAAGAAGLPLRVARVARALGRGAHLLPGAEGP